MTSARASRPHPRSECIRPLGADPIVTTGTISALSGLRNDRRNIQISAPVQPGNSGGPLLGEDGSIVGVVVEKIDAIKVARATGDIPQNVNFAISLGTLQSFLNANGVAYALSDGKGTKSPAEIAAEASRYTVSDRAHRPRIAPRLVGMGQCCATIWMRTAAAIWILKRRPVAEL